MFLFKRQKKKKQKEYAMELLFTQTGRDHDLRKSRWEANILYMF